MLSLSRRLSLSRASLRGKLLGAFLAVLLPVLALLLANYENRQSSQVEASLNDQLLTAQAVAIQVDEAFDAAVGVGWAVANDPLLQTMDPSLLDPHLSDLVARHQTYDAINVFDAQGINRGWGSVTEPAEPRLNIADRDFFRTVMATNAPTVSNVLLLRRPIVVGIVACVPIRGVDGRPVGVVNVVMRTDQLAKKYEETRLQPGQAILLVDPTARLAFHTRRPQLTYEESGAYADFGPIRAALAGSPVQVAEFVSPVIGDSHLGAFVPTRKYGWAAGVTMPRAIALAQSQAALRGQLAVFTAILLFSIALSVLLARFLADPVRRLGEAAQRLGRGDLSSRVRIKTGDELEQLGDAFNEMAEQLGEWQGEVLRLRAQAEQRARHLSAVIASMADAVYVASADGKLVDVNPSGLRLLSIADRSELGSSIDDFHRRYGLRFLDGRPMDLGETPLRRALAGETFSGFDLCLRDHRGDDLQVSASGAPVRDEAGQVTLGVVVIRDVTEQRRVEETVRESERRFRTIFDGAPVGISIVGPDGRVIESNLALQQMLGYSDAELRTMTFSDFSYEDDVDEDRRYFAELVGGKRDYYEIEKRYRRRGGTVLWGDLAVSLVRDARGEPQFAIRMVEDVTRRKQAEEERSRLLAREQALAEIAQALVRELELEGVVDVVLEQSLRVLGFDAILLWRADPSRRELELLGERDNPPESVDLLRVVSYDAPLLSARAARTEETQVVEDLDHAEAPALSREFRKRYGFRGVLAIPLRRRGRLIGVVTYLTRSLRRFSARDLEFNATVADLFAVAIENARLFNEVRDALRIREEFMAGAAHELKTPVTVIRGWAEALLRMGERETRERKALEAIDNQSARIAHLIDDLLAAIRLRPGPAALQRERFDQSALVRDLAARVGRMAERHELRVTAGEPFFVLADRHLISEVVIHLLENAIRYSPEGGPVEVDVRRSDDEVVTSVRDYGFGIQPERQPHVFEPFYESVASGEPGYVGIVSLGLHLGKQIVEAHGGRIWFVSAPGQGSTFTFSLPLT